MTLWQLKVFATVAREGSFTKAGKILNISQPSVSSLIIGLQKELRVKLFEKLGIKSHLTEAGRRLLQLTEGVLATLEKIPEEMAQVMGLKKGRIRVGGSALAAASFLPGMVQQFKKEHLGIETVLKIQRSDSLETALLEGELDVAILGWAPRSRLIVGKPYREERIVAIAPPYHPLTKRRSVPLALIAREPLIIQEKGALMRNIVEEAFAKTGLPLKVRLEVNTQFAARDTIRNAVARDLGVGFISHCHVAGDIEAGRLKIIKISDVKLTRTTYIVVHKRRQTSPHVQTFIDFIKRHNP
jgi:LysR family transcriptional regulator, low CO2-responsive transcriptional regulator